MTSRHKTHSEDRIHLEALVDHLEVKVSLALKDLRALMSSLDADRGQVGHPSETSLMNLRRCLEEVVQEADKLKHKQRVKTSC